MYKKAIDLLVGMSNVEKEKLAVELAKHHPAIFVKLALGEEKEEVMIEGELVSVLDHLKGGRRLGEMDVFLSSSQKRAVKSLLTPTRY